jgi:hypothetical protein
MADLKGNLLKYAKNFGGWTTRRKILVFDSDDWGSIRMPSKEVLDLFVSQGFIDRHSVYNSLDSLESNDDLTQLFDVLSSYHDAHGHPAVMTANLVVGNPDFSRIRQSGFSEYHAEPVTETLKRYSYRDQVEKLWKEGLASGVFIPQFHGREHVNVIRWMKALKERSNDIMLTFDHETTFSGKGDYNFMEVLDFNTREDLYSMIASLKEGLRQFDSIFGYQARSFVPPCYVWTKEIEEAVAEQGIRYISGISFQLLPTGKFGNYKRTYHFQGQKNRNGQSYLIRNAFFEPSLIKNADPVEECLNHIRIAFNCQKPAIVSCHRINFIGSLNEANRTVNLSLLGQLLKKVTENWPDIEFMSSDQLGDLMTSKKQYT